MGATLIRLALLAMATDLSAATAGDALALWGPGSDKGFDGIYERQVVPTSAAKPLPENIFNGISSVTGARRYIGVVGLESKQSLRDPAGFFLIDRDSGRRTKIFEDKGLVSGALSRDARFVAFVVCHPVSCDLSVRDVGGVGEGQVLATSVHDKANPAWSPDGRRIAIATSDGWIVIVDLATKSQQRLVEGESPTWSPDGKQLAYVAAERSIWIYDNIVRHKPSKTYERRFWQTRIVGPVSWGPNDVIAFNVPTGPTGYEIECLLLDVKSGNTMTLQNDGLWCGPWLD